MERKFLEPERASGSGHSMDSGREARFHFRIDLRPHEFRPEDSASTLADLGLEIQHKESLKDIAGQKSDQQEALDGVGVVLQNPQNHNKTTTKPGQPDLTL